MTVVEPAQHGLDLDPGEGREGSGQLGCRVESTSRES